MKVEMDYGIVNGKVYYQDRWVRADIGIKDGEIRVIKKKLDVDVYIDAYNKCVLPGVIDAHVHLRDMNQKHKEDFKTGTLAAAHGGVTTVLDMPNTEPPTTSLDAINQKEELRRDTAVQIEFFGGIKNNLPEIMSMKDKIIGYKIYMDSTPLHVSKPELREIFEFFAKNKINKRISVHVDDSELTKRIGKQKISEIRGIEFISNLSRQFGIKVNICHVSTPEGIKIISQNPNLTCEVTPHHLFLNEENFGFADTNPPLRNQRDIAGLWKNLNQVDIIASDHAPHTMEEKHEGAEGFPGLETTLPLLLNAVVCRRLLPSRLIALISRNPARIFGLTDKGEIKPGYCANLTIVDFHKKYKIRGEDLYTKCGWTPFEGWEGKGAPTHTIVDGRILMKDGVLLD